MPAPTDHLEAQGPCDVGEQLLAVLRRTGRSHRVTDLTEAFGMSGAWDRFEAALDSAQAGLVLIVGRHGFELRAA